MKTIAAQAVGKYHQDCVRAQKGSFMLRATCCHNRPGRRPSQAQQNLAVRFLIVACP
jgi:hypothetical protein